MKKIYYHKLICDKVADRMRKLGKAFETKKLSKGAFERALVAKVEEEAGGVANARTRKELVDELTDLFVVIDEIKKVKKIKPIEFQVARKINMKAKGGFEKRLWLVWSQNDGYTTNERKGRK